MRVGTGAAACREEQQQLTSARDKAKDDAIKLQMALTREMDANKAEAVTQALDISRMEKELAGTYLPLVASRWVGHILPFPSGPHVAYTSGDFTLFWPFQLH